ncbi:MAG TPA: hypothetical protein ENF73_04475 [Proteobacteria bacterium]|nr:hypothetical protein [Pseudomonadota bacterium]
MRDRICLLVLIPPYPDGIVEVVSAAIADRFGWGVETTTGPDAGFAYNAARRQYSAHKLLDAVVGLANERHIRALGITDLDLYVVDLNFVFGLALMNGAGAIVSTCRLKPEFYGLAPDGELLASRAVKEIVHELGHTLGLSHCSDKGCVMSFSNHIGEVDAKGDGFCPRCRRVLNDRLARL